MTSTGDDAFRVVPRRALPPAVAVWVAAVVLGALLSGAGAAFGAVAGGAVAVAFLASTFWTLRLIKKVDPRTGMFVALFAYLIKITLLAVVVLLLKQVEALSGVWVAGTAGACTATWIVAIIVAFKRLRTPVFDVLTGRGN